MITQEEAREYFHYEDGELYRRKLTNRSSKIGEKVGSLFGTGYRRMSWRNKSVAHHRVVWIYHYGSVTGQIDHINRNKCDNRIENLRCVTASVNASNRGTSSSNSSGVVGVSFNTAQGKWKVSINTDSGRKYLGYYKDKNEAIKVRKDAEIIHGYKG